MNYNTLYPVVHDLTEAETSHGCCGGSYMDVSPGCFSLQDLVNPEFSAIPATPNTGTETPKRAGGLFRRQSSIPVNYGIQYPHPLRSLVDDRNDKPWSMERKILFTETYVLTRQVSLVGSPDFCTVAEKKTRTITHLTHPLLNFLGAQGTNFQCLGVCAPTNGSSLCCQGCG
jgi:hypothetical protein